MTYSLVYKIYIKKKKKKKKKSDLNYKNNNKIKKISYLKYTYIICILYYTYIRRYSNINAYITGISKSSVFLVNLLRVCILVIHT